MKSIVFLFAGFRQSHAFDKVFSSSSAFARCLVWACGIKDSPDIFIAAVPETEGFVKDAVKVCGLKNVSVVSKPSWTTLSLVQTMASSCTAKNAGCAVYSAADRPFLDNALTQEVMDCHSKYLAEYTFADGYPKGFAPEVIDAGTLAILSSLAQDRFKEAGDAPVSSECLWNLIKGDINSFEIECVVAPKDWRLLRLDFSCCSKINLEACKNLYKAALDERIPFKAESLSDFAENRPDILKTVPAFYNIQISAEDASVADYTPAFLKCTGGMENMGLEKFRALLSQIAEFSETAVVGLSARGEPLKVNSLCDYIESVLSFPGLSVLVETDGTLVTETLADKILVALKNAPARAVKKSAVTWIVMLDAFSEEKYSSMRHGGNFAAAVNAVQILGRRFPSCVYPQFTRVNENEDELEKFYRFWHEKDSPSGGKLIVKKYDSCCAVLPDRKPADLSPLERCPCWHLRRDMIVLCDGSVPLCQECIGEEPAGNVFEEGVQSVWNKIELSSDGTSVSKKDKCGKCDEYYTFNF